MASYSTRNMTYTPTPCQTSNYQMERWNDYKKENNS